MVIKLDLWPPPTSLLWLLAMVVGYCMGTLNERWGAGGLAPSTVWEAVWAGAFVGLAVTPSVWAWRAAWHRDRLIMKGDALTRAALRPPEDAP